jgi:phosphohistidine phosphatase SixA
MRIYVIRHSVPEPDGGENGEEDSDPVLSKEGREYAENLAAWMVDKEEIPTVFITSPMTRTRETAEIIADAIEKAGFAAPAVKEDVGIGPEMSIKQAVLDAAADPSMVRVGFVSHHESIAHGLRVLGMEPFVHLDQFAKCELRIYKVKRKSGKWDEHRRLPPSDLGGIDNY